MPTWLTKLRQLIQQGLIARTGAVGNHQPPPNPK